MRRTVLFHITVLAALTGLAAEAGAQGVRQRSSWMANIGFGVNRGSFDDSDDSLREYSDGAIPQIRFGRMLGNRLMVSVNYHGWIVEFDREGDIVLENAKVRRSLQDLTLGLTLFPGSMNGWTGGFFVRAGGGMGWSGTSIIPVFEDEAQEHGYRLDEWGSAWFGEAGYEFWISRTSTIGLLGNYTYFDIGGDIVTSAWTGGLSVNLSLYF